jgi:hypothetical protein
MLLAVGQQSRFFVRPTPAGGAEILLDECIALAAALGRSNGDVELHVFAVCSIFDRPCLGICLTA